ncbi:MAG: ABC transporter permease subunit [Acidimicrobiia bacterium]|nr:ABC transporter permease subunit [Acidimicrobiia bacterium]
MRQAVTIAARDLRATYVSAFGIGCTAAFAALAGVLLVFDLRPNQARLDLWFSSLFVALGLLAALLTQRAFAEEERSGTLELLLTSPVRFWQVAVGKLLGVAGVLAAAIAATVVCPILVASMGNPDGGPIITGYIGLVVVGVGFLALGLAVSASTPNPLVSAAGTAAVLVALWLAGVLAGGLGGRLHVVLEYLSPTSHVTGFLRGTLAVTDVAYFLSMTVVGVVGVIAILGWRR